MATDVDALLLRIEASATKLEKDMAKARGTFDRQAKAMEKRADDLARKVSASISGAVPDFGRVGAATGATLASVLSVEAIGTYADKWRSVGNLIAAAGGETETLAVRQSTVADIAERARSDLEGTGDLYARLTRSSKDLGASEAEVAVATETVLKGLKISGASAAEAASSALQLSQALQSGVLGGDELRSLLEGAPVIAQAIAKEFGVGVGELKKLGSEGKLTATRVFKAIVASADDVEKAFAKTKATTADAFAVLETRAARWIGTSALVRTATDAAGGAVATLGANFGTVATGATALGAILAARLIGAGLTPLVTGFAAATAGAVGTVASMNALNVALVATVARTNAAALATAGLNRALMLVGGPVGAVLLALGAAYLYVAEKNHEAEERAKTYATSLDEVKRQARESAGAIDLHTDAVVRAAEAQAAEKKNVLGKGLAETENDIATFTARIRQALAGYAAFGREITDPADRVALAALARAFDGSSESAAKTKERLFELANANPDFQAIADRLKPLLEVLIAAGAHADILRARLAAVPAAVEAASTKAIEAKITPKTPAATFDEATAAAGNDPVLRALQGQGMMQRAVADAELDETAKKIKDTRKKLLAEILGAGGIVDPKALDLAASRIVAGEAARKKSGGSGAEDDGNEYTRAKQRAEEQTAVLKAETDAVALSEEAKLRAKKAQELKNAADRAGIDLSPEMAGEIERVSAAYAAQETALKKAEASQRHAQETQRYLAETMVDGLADLALEGKSFAQVAESIAKALAKAALQAALLGSGPLAGLFGTSVSSSGGILGTLFKSILGFDEGGWTGAASRGAVTGVVHGQEYVVRAGQAKKFLPLLEAINRGVPGFAAGGWTGGARPSLALPDLAALSGRARAGGDDPRPIRVAMKVETPDVAGFRRSQTQIAAEMTRALRRGQRGL